MAASDGSFGRMALLVKIYENKDYADDFRDGLLYANSVEYYRNIEERPRGDANEGVILLESGTLRMRREGEDEWFTVETAGPARLTFDHISGLNLFCTTLFLSDYSDRLEPRMIEQVQQQIAESLSTCLDMGHHAVLIRDAPELMKRIAAATRDREIQFWSAPVNYYDSYPFRSDSWSRTSIQPVLWKHERYQLQREFRVVLNDEAKQTDHIELHIGDISDISSYMKTEELASLEFSIQ